MVGSDSISRELETLSFLVMWDRDLNEEGRLMEPEKRGTIPMSAMLAYISHSAHTTRGHKSFQKVV